MREHVRDVRELLLEVALVRLEPLDEVLTVRERPVEEEPGVSMVSVVHVHLLSA